MIRGKMSLYFHSRPRISSDTSSAGMAVGAKAGSGVGVGICPGRAVAASASALAIFYLLFVGCSLLRGGSLSMEVLQGFVFHLAFVALAVAMALAGSLVVTPSANLTLSATALTAMFFFGRRLPDYADAVSAPLSWLVRLAYALGPHVEFFDMRQRLIHGWGGVDAVVFAAVLAYAVAYAGVCLVFAWLILKRKRF